MSGPRATDLLVRIDAGSGASLQHQIYSGIRRAILDGIVGAGARLPSSRALADDLGVSRTTTLLAIDQLLAEGYLSTRQGSGTFVADELPDDLASGRTARVRPAPRQPPLSQRGLALSALPPAARRVGGPVRPFRIGTPGLDLFPLRIWTQLVNRRLRSISASQLDYGDAAGLGALREAIADHVRTARGTTCTADQVIVVAGAQRGLQLVASILLDPGDPAWMEDPGFQGARSALVGAGARVVPVRVDEEGLDVDAGARRAGDARLVFVTPSHQFPLGVPMTLPRRLALLKWAADARAWIVEDDYDSEFRYGERPIPCLHGLDADGRVIYVGSFSKSIFPALRLGFLIAPPELRDRVLAVRRASDLHPPAIDQAVLADFIGEGHFARHLRRMRSAYRERLDAVTDAAARYCGDALRIRAVRTGLHAVADVHGVDAERVWNEAAARDVEVMPLAAYSAGRSRVANALVMGFAAVESANAVAGMQRLAAAMEAAAR